MLFSSSTQNVRLTCQGGPSFPGGFAIAPSVGTRRANPMLVSNWLTPDDLSVRWSGNGSLISFSNNQAHSDSQVGYGRTRDVAVTFPGAYGGLRCRSATSPTRSGCGAGFLRGQFQALGRPTV